MTPALAAFAATLAAALPPELCTAVPPPAKPDPAEAAAYVEIAEAELAAGHDEVAARALRAALAKDGRPGSRAAQLLATLCAAADLAEPGDVRRADPEAALAAAAERADADDCDGVMRELERVPRPNAAASLLEGVCRFEAGEDDEARAALEVAAGAPETSDSARLLLALLAYREGEAESAAAQLSARRAGGAPDSRPIADIRKLIRRGDASRLAVVVQAEGAVDSNPELTSTASAAPDGAVRLALLVETRPFGRRGPYVQLSGEGLKYTSSSTYDAFTAAAGAGWRFGPPEKSATAEYAFVHTVRGGSAYSSFHDLSLRGRWFWGAGGVGAAYLARVEVSHLDDEISVLQYGDVSGTWYATEDLWIGGGYMLSREITSAISFRYWDHGPRLDAGVRFGERVQLFGSARATHRLFDDDGAGGGGFAELDLDLALTGEIDLEDRVTLVVSSAVTRGLSEVGSRDLLRVIGAFGLRFAAGLL